MTEKTIVVGHHPGKTLDSMPIECCGKFSREDTVKAGDVAILITQEAESMLQSIFTWADVQVVFIPAVFAPFKIWADVHCNDGEPFRVDIIFEVDELLNVTDCIIPATAKMVLDCAIRFLLKNNRPQLKNNRPHQG